MRLEPGATKETKVAVAAEGVLPSPQSAPFQRTSKAAASDLKTPEKKDEEGQHGVGSVEKSVAPQSDPKMSEPPHMSTPMTPLFDENQLRRFQELYAQAPWLYPQHVPHAPLSLMPPGQFLPPVQRPLFLEQDERRMHEEGRVGSSGFHGHGHDRSMDVDRENRELRRNLEKVLRENQLLRERVDALEFQKLDEDQRFATPNGFDGQLERPPKKEADRPPKRPREAEEAFNSGSGKEAERLKVLKDQGRLQTPTKVKRRQLAIHRLRSRKSHWKLWH